ncbi:CYTH domain-containing protein [Acinetobacter cumulans]|uniref:CYTH domain-containing protein n=1 Tax=Acinetobacter cumulans TaxID=2136182 RepID=A0A498D819_9GAMM|nr:MULTISPECIES: CYTH domain-containing protein [Acinetobacter]RFS32721.1 CYTH domain-containing protein [Acinetobacter sp. SWAC5]RKG43761.1 CYTH domain-containing protein [Acinetobacter cumulans]RKG48107.1 CYTH domain-containing protein [Acinetobacter cumulans]RLL31579.1 CYTH domain-containing protein [Acinetobacter cumulans]RZG59477.1 CYTH domain-containing protein [Acinetobacter sp. WCHAc060006]
MVEVELKFQIPEARRAALLKAIDPKKSEQIQLKAKYFDTADKLMAQQHAAIRQRLEGDRWIQTLKAAGKTHIERFEHNLDLGIHENAPELDLSVYQQHTDALQVLKNALGDQVDQLQLQFETDILRTCRVIQYEDAEIEVSLDVGCIRTQHAEEIVHEVEFELKQGSIQSLLAFCFEWVKKYQLWLDVRSKAEIGNLLVASQVVSPAVVAKDFVLSKKEPASQNLKTLVAQQMQHLLPNIAAISASVATPEHMQEARTALKHLQLTISLFKDWNPDVSDKWGYQLEAFKQQFDQLQHFEHMRDTLGAFLQNPTTAENLAKDILYAKEKLGNLVKSTLNVHHYLELMMFSLNETQHVQSHDLKWFAHNTLQQQYKLLQDSLNLADITDFESLDVLARHIQELKFSFPILTSIYDVKNLQKYGKALNDAQLAAHEYQVLSTSAQYIQQTELEASDWFVLGWLTAKQEVYAQRLLEATEQFLVSRKLIK